MNFLELIRLHEQNFHHYKKLFNQLKKDNSFQQQGEIKGLLHQLVCIHDEVINYRLIKILSEEHPYIPQIRLNRLSINSHLFAMGTSQIVDHFLNQRMGLLSLIRTLGEDEWCRKGLHEREGHVSFGEFVERMAKKDEDVLKRLQAFSQKIGVKQTET